MCGVSMFARVPRQDEVAALSGEERRHISPFDEVEFWKGWNRAEHSISRNLPPIGTAAAKAATPTTLPVTGGRGRLIGVSTEVLQRLGITEPVQPGQSPPMTADIGWGRGRGASSYQSPRRHFRSSSRTSATSSRSGSDSESRERHRRAQATAIVPTPLNVGTPDVQPRGRPEHREVWMPTAQVQSKADRAVSPVFFIPVIQSQAAAGLPSGRVQSRERQGHSRHHSWEVSAPMTLPASSKPSSLILWLTSSQSTEKESRVATLDDMLYDLAITQPVDRSQTGPADIYPEVTPATSATNQSSTSSATTTVSTLTGSGNESPSNPDRTAVGSEINVL